MDYQSAENQIATLHRQADQTVQTISTLASKLQTKISDADLARELTLDLREAALAIQQQNQSASMLIEQMAEYIHTLESHVNTQPQPTFQTRGWSSGPWAGGGGFMSNLVSGLGMGAGFGLANDLVGDIFNAL